MQEFRNRAKVNNFEVPYSLMAIGEELQGHRHFSDNNLASASRYTAKRQNRRDRNLSQNIMSADSMNDDEALNQLMMSPPNSLRGGIPSQIRNRLMLEKSKLYSS